MIIQSLYVLTSLCDQQKGRKPTATNRNGNLNELFMESISYTEYTARHIDEMTILSAEKLF